MAAIKSEMPPLHAADGGTATALSGMGSGGVSSVGGGGGGGSSGGGNGSNAVNAGTVSNSTTNTTSSSASSASTTSASTANGASVNNTISAAADSSDNQPGTPQPQTQQLGVNEQQQQQQQQQQQLQQQAATSTGSSIAHHPYATHNMYATTSTTTPGTLPHMYAGSIYATSTGNNIPGHDMQQTYPNYLNSYEQFYQHQTQSSQNSVGGGGNGSSGLDFGNASTLYGSNTSSDYKASSGGSTGVRYHPYLQTPTSNGPASGGGGNSNEGHDASASVTSGDLSLSGNNGGSGAVSTTTAMSPRIVSSSSPTSTSTQLHMGSGNSVGGNPQSPACGGPQLLCKKCGIMCTNETELQEHITNVHGASPYGSSGYSSSPYIKEELSGAPPPQTQQQQAGSSGGGNPGEILDLDSQKMVFPPIPGSMQSIMGHSGLHHHQQQQLHHSMHDPIVNDPLHSMHTMQQRALPGWDQAPNGNSQEGLPSYMQQTDITGKVNQSPYYSPKQSPYHPNSGSIVGNIKHEYPLIKSEYADSQNYVDKSFDPTVGAAGGPDMCQPQQQGPNGQQSMLPVSSSPAEFPSTTTGPAQEQQQAYRGFEPPTSSSVLPANSITAKAATWKSNEARRPKTYNCTACNKWFTSSGHLKRHYNTTLHKNAVKTSGQPDPATLPISAHHHPARDPSGKHSRRGGNNNSAAAAAAQQQKPPAPVQPPEPPRTPPDYASQAAVIGSVGASGLGPMSHYSTSPSPTQTQQANLAVGGQPIPFGQQNGYQQQQPAYMGTSNVSPSSQHSQTQSQTTAGTVLNGHPNGLAGPSAPTTTAAMPAALLMPSSHTRGLLNTTTTTTTTIIKREVSAEEDINNTTTTTISSSSPMGMVAMGKEMVMSAALDEVAAGTEAVADMQHTRQHHHHHHHQPQQQQQLLVKQELPDLDQGYRLLDQQQQQQQHRLYRSNTPNSRAQSPLIISHQQYQEQLQLEQQQQIMADNIFSQQQQVHMLQPPLPLQANTMEAYSIIPLGINTQQQHSNNMQLLPPWQRITSTTPTTANMLDSIPMLPQHSLLRHHLPQQLEQQQAEQLEPPNTLSNTTTITSMQDTQQRINTITPQPLHTLTPLPQLQPSITNPIIPSFQPLQPQEAQLPLEHTMTYHTIIGSTNSSNNNSNTNNNSSTVCDNNGGDLLQLGTYDSYNGTPMLTTTSDGQQILQFFSNGGNFMQQTYFTSYPTRHAAVPESYVRSYSSSTSQRSPQEADLPPANNLTQNYAQAPQESQTTLTVPPAMPYSPTISSSTAGDVNASLLDDYNNTTTTTNIDYQDSTIIATPKMEPLTAAKKSKRSSPNNNNKLNPPKRKRISSSENGNTNVSTTSTTSTTTLVMPSGRIKCLECDKEFSKICYLTQHNKCFHSGEYPYRCEKCGKRFQNEDVYTTHLGRHKTQDKPHKCELCPKQFHHKTDLRRHIEAIHTGLKQHCCDICEKSFCRKDHLRKHLETHNKPRVVQRKASAKASPQARTKLSAKEAKTFTKSESTIIDNSKPPESPADLKRSTAITEAYDDSNGPGDTANLDVLVVIKNEAVLMEENPNCTEFQTLDAIYEEYVPDDDGINGD